MIEFSDKSARDREELTERSRSLLTFMRKRHSIRHFSPDSVPRDVIENCISCATSGPSGANMQPWSFVLVEDPGTKKAIRRKSEEVEKKFYDEKISDEWSEKLKPLGTNWEKPFLEEAQYLICIFVQRYGIDPRGSKITHYYPFESVGIATGLLIAGLHLLDLSCLTYTPSPMTFLTELLERPVNERPFIILAVGLPDPTSSPPELPKKTPEEYLTIL